MSNFKTIAFALRDYVSGTYDLLAAAEAVERVLPGLDVPVPAPVPQEDFSHDALVSRVLANGNILGFLLNHQKISAIKELRFDTDAGLKQSKDAVEDYRVDVMLRCLREPQHTARRP